MLKKAGSLRTSCGAGVPPAVMRASCPRMEAVTLRTVAEHVGLAPCSVSAILNDSAAGMSIPQHTKERVRRAASLLNYKPNYYARSLRTRRTFTVALLAPDIGHAPAARIAAGAEHFLRQKGYCLLVANCDPSLASFQDHFTQLRQRGVEGIIAIQSKPLLPSGFPTAFLDCAPVDFNEPTSIATHRRRAQSGKAAAKFLMRKIERGSSGLAAVSWPATLAAEVAPESSKAHNSQAAAHFAD